jgi:hypothetical protein
MSNDKLQMPNETQTSEGQGSDVIASQTKQSQIAASMTPRNDKPPSK